MYKSKKIWMAVLAVLVLVVFMYIFQMNKNVNTNITVNEVVQSNDGELQSNLSKVTSLSANNLKKSKERDELKENTEKLIKLQFLGAFIAIKKSKIIFGGQRGYANAGLRTKYSVNSMVFINEFQDILNTAVLIHFIDVKHVATSRQVEDYLKLPQNGQISISNFLESGSDYYIKSTSLKEDASSNNPFSYLKDIRYFNERPKGYKSADTLIKAMLISKLSGTSYTSALSIVAINKLGLTNTEFYNRRNDYVNNVFGYKYDRENGKVVQKKKIEVNYIYPGMNDLKMSFSDVLNVVDGIFRNKLFSKSYNEIFRNSISNEKSVIVNSKNVTFFSEGQGQTWTLRMDFKNKNMVMVMANYPNKKPSVGSELNQLYQIIEN